MNWIQQHILVELTRHSQRRYSELRPDGVEGNLFLYHLDGLLREGKVIKADKHYELSDSGKQEISRLSLVTGKPRLQPQILTAIVCNNNEQFLWFRWMREPNKGKVSLPHGMLHFGETIIEAANRELSEKTGLEGELNYLGEVYVRVFEGDEVRAHILVHLVNVSGVNMGKMQSLRPEIGESFWARLDEIDRKEFLPGFFEIMELLEKNNAGSLFADIKVRVNREKQS